LLLNFPPQFLDITTHFISGHTTVSEQSRFCLPTDEVEGEQPGRPTVLFSSRVVGNDAYRNTTNWAWHEYAPVARTSLSESRSIRGRRRHLHTNRRECESFLSKIQEKLLRE